MAFISGALLVGCLVIFLVWNAIQWFTKWRKMPPGPYGLPLVGYLPFIYMSPPPMHDHLFRKLHNKYGPIVSVGISQFRDIVLVGDAELAQELAKKEELVCRGESLIFDIMSSGGAGHLMRYGKLWHDNRKFAIRFFQDFAFRDRNRLNDLIMLDVLEVAEILNDNLDKPFDVGVTFNMAAMRNLWRMVSKRSSDFSLTDVFIINKLFEGIGRTEDLILVMSPKGFLNYLKYIFPESWKNSFLVKEALEWGDQFVRQDISDHRRDGVDDDYIGRYLAEIDRQKGTGGTEEPTLTEEELVTNVRSLFVVGAETSSTAISWAVKHLMENPDIQRRAQEEVDKVIGRERPPHIDDQKQMPYLTAFIEENNRISSPIPSFPRHALQDVHCRGYLIPKGTTCLINVLAYHRNEKIFPEPEVFNPERFLDAEGNFVKPPKHLLTFGCGKRICFGENMARTQLFLYIATFLQRFTFSLPSEPLAKKKPTWWQYVNYPPSLRIRIQKRT